MRSTTIPRCVFCQHTWSDVVHGAINTDLNSSALLIALTIIHFRTLLTKPPDPINHVCSLTGKYIPKRCFTYRSVQIFKIMFRRFLFSRIWSSAQDHMVLVLLLNLLVFSFPTDRICQMEMICIGGVPLKNSFSAGPDLNYFYMIHRGGRNRRTSERNLLLLYNSFFKAFSTVDFFQLSK